jgi:hypothetical protein
MTRLPGALCASALVFGETHGCANLEALALTLLLVGGDPVAASGRYVLHTKECVHWCGEGIPAAFT